MNPDALAAVVIHVAEVMIAHADELTDLDRAIGDGDHGTNVRRGFQAVLREADSWRMQPPPRAIEAVGRTLVMAVGGAFGPLVGTALMVLGGSLTGRADPAGWAAAARAATEAVKARGRSDVGHKTLIDVLEPVCRGLAKGADLVEIKAVASAAADATVGMRAFRGRAAYLGERSVGHMDPGARSASLMIAAAIDAVTRLTTAMALASAP